MNDVHAISDPGQAATILAHPLRSKILAAAQQPVSASDIARALGLPRQRINYHVRELAEAGLLMSASQQRKRNMLEQQYVASARSYILNSDVLGEIAPAEEAGGDPSSAGRLAAVCARTQRDVTALMAAASNAGLRLKTLALEEDLYFDNAQQRADFMRGVVEAVQDVVSEYSARAPQNSGARAFRLLLACYPQAE